MCLLCNGKVKHGERSFEVQDRVRFRSDAPTSFREKYPGTLTVQGIRENSPEQSEKLGRQTLILSDTRRLPVEIAEGREFSCDFFELES